MRHGSLFSGIGGFDFAASKMGWENVFHCEWNEFGRKILKYYWPNAQSYEDIRNTNFSIYRGRIDVLTGGFPCQPFSTAGKRKGTDDDRHLWPEMLRAIREIQPSWILGENVRGIVNWSSGLVFEQVCAEMEAQGYKVQPFILPACGVNAPHRRERVWFIAFNTQRQSNVSNYRKESIRNGMEMEREELVQSRRKQSTNDIESSDSNAADSEGKRSGRLPFRKKEENPVDGVYGSDGTSSNSSIEDDGGNKRKEKGRQESEFRNGPFANTITNAYSFRQQKQGESKRSSCKKQDKGWEASWANHDGSWPTQSPICSGDDGISSGLDGITFSKWRQESIKGYGNAIVPQVALQIFKSIQEYENLV